MQLILLNEGPSTQLPLVLLHGWGHSSSIWRSWLEQAAPGRQVYGINLPGFGDEAQNAPQSLAHTLNALTALLPAACVLVGWSLGGMLACQLACSNKVKGLLSLAANPSFIARPHWPWAMAPEVFAQFQHNFAEDPAATVQRFSQLQTQGDANRKVRLAEIKSLAPALQPAAWAAALSWLAEVDNSALIPQLRQPQRHLFAEADSLVPATAASACPHSQVVPGGHLLPLGAQGAISQALHEIDHAITRKPRIARAFSQAAGHYDQHALLQQRLGAELIQQLTPAHQRILDIGCGTGFIARSLTHPAEVINLDLAWGMLKTLPQGSLKLQADAEHLPFASASFNAITANLALQWCDLPRVLSEAKRCLTPGGALVFNTLTEGTLSEIAQAWAEVDRFPHVNTFPSIEAILEQCRAAGFSQMQWQVARHRVVDDNLKSLLMSIKGIGAKNQQPGRFTGLTPRARLNAFNRAMQQHAWDGECWGVSYQVLTLYLQA
ncbi:MAG: hypothetical protein RL497_1808 [Pseudomonadota bacterium]|jgi:malonyl-CoA O-methyltransferase